MQGGVTNALTRQKTGEGDVVIEPAAARRKAGLGTSASQVLWAPGGTGGRPACT